MKKYTLILISLLMATAAVAAASDITADTKARLSNSLAKATAADDSIRILYDLFDIAPRAEKHGIGDELYNLALRNKRYDTALDVLRLCGGLSTDPQAINLHIQRAAALPPSLEKDESILFLQMKKMAILSRSLSYEKQREAMLKIETKIKQNSGHPRKLHDHLLDLYSVTEYLRNSSSSKMLTEYMDSLYTLANNPAIHLYAIPNLIYSEAANIFSDAGMFKKAIDADKKLLTIISSLEKKYNDQGRKYRYFNTNKYISYRRMLRNFKGLTTAEAKHYYARILELAAVDPEVAADLNSRHSVKGYYFMATGNNAAAIPELKSRIEIEKALPAKRLQLALLKEAAAATGDTANLVFALQGLNDILNEMDSTEIDRHYNELQYAYDIASLKNKNANLRSDMDFERSNNEKQKVSLSLLFWVIIAVLLLVLFFYYKSYRSTHSTMRNISDAIHQQRDRLKQSRFSDDFQSDNDKKNDKKKNFLHSPYSLKLNPNIVETALSDMLYISAIGSDDSKKYIYPVTINDVFHACDNWLRNDGDHSLTALNMIYPEKNISLITDPDCLVFVLTRIFRFAAKSAIGGSVDLAVELSPDSQELIFRFAHTGVRIPRGKEELLFRDFIQTCDLTSDNEFALFYCRMNAFLLHSRLSYNPIDNGPATLYFTIPYTAPEK